ncbi:MAG TPA: UDP-glucose 6-dehydrogenase, partial [Candidatus Rifleibacterium sp.]|nr:UDP-glucose 6-dehydrogenase [Candidatus Rifleibacterium sp.]
MKIAMIGTGYVGLVTGTCFAESGNDVVCVDTNEQKINDLKNGIIPIYEPGLDTLVKRNVEEERLSFTTNLEEAVKKSLLLFIAVGTPPGDTGARVRATIQEELDRRGENIPFDVVSNPEFLKEGNAIDDFMKPDRVVIGCEDVRTGELMKELYSPFVRTGKPIIVMDLASAEMT